MASSILRLTVTAHRRLERTNLYVCEPLLSYLLSGTSLLAPSLTASQSCRATYILHGPPEPLILTHTHVGAVRIPSCMPTAPLDRALCISCTNGPMNCALSPIMVQALSTCLGPCPWAPGQWHRHEGMCFDHIRSQAALYHTWLLPR